MATTNFTSLLGLALPTTGDLTSTWGDEVNNSITALLDTAVAGVSTLSTDANVTLTTTDGAANTSRALILNNTGARTAARTITAPAKSKAYIVINATTGGFAVNLVGAGPTTGISIAAGENALVAWNGSDFVKIAFTGTAAVFTWMTTPSSANLRSAMTDETGTGALVFATSPTLVTPVLGTPASGTLSNCTVDGTNNVGYRNRPQSSKSVDYTLVLADAGNQIYHPATDSTQRTFTIPANASVAYPLGTLLHFANSGIANVIIAITSDTLRLAGTASFGSRTLAPNGIATAVKIDTAEWLISGAGIT